MSISGALSRIEARLQSRPENVESTVSLSERTCHTNAEHGVSISIRASSSLVLDTTSPDNNRQIFENAKTTAQLSGNLKIQSAEQASSISELKNAVLSQITQTLLVQQNLSSSQPMTAIQCRPGRVSNLDLLWMKKEISTMYAMDLHVEVLY